MTLVGLLLGAGLASYSILSSKAIGFAFPIINGEFAVRPTFNRVISFLIGKGLGFIGIGWFVGWVGSSFELDVINRLIFSLTTLLGLFLLLFSLISDSPELKFIRYSDVSEHSLPPFFLGCFSSFILMAPNIIGWLWALSMYKNPDSVIFFANIFLGQIILLIPKILNMKWAKGRIYLYFTRLILVFCSLTVLILSINRLLKL